MDIVLYIIGGSLFLLSVPAHVWVRVRLRPREDSDLEDYYYEFEDQHPGYARYTKWSRITFATGTIGVLLLFVAYMV